MLCKSLFTQALFGIGIITQIVITWQVLHPIHILQQVTSAKSSAKVVNYQFEKSIGQELNIYTYLTLLQFPKRPINFEINVLCNFYSAINLNW